MGIKTTHTREKTLLCVTMAKWIELAPLPFLGGINNTALNPP